MGHIDTKHKVLLPIPWYIVWLEDLVLIFVARFTAHGTSAPKIRHALSFDRRGKEKVIIDASIGFSTDGFHGKGTVTQTEASLVGRSIGVPHVQFGRVKRCMVPLEDAVPRQTWYVVVRKGVPLPLAIAIRAYRGTRVRFRIGQV
jgi:hypothetical protein